MNFSPAMWKPDDWIFLTSPLSLKDVTTSLNSGPVGAKPLVVAQTLLPSELNIAALSSEPVPTRLGESEEVVLMCQI